MQKPNNNTIALLVLVLILTLGFVSHYQSGLSDLVGFAILQNRCDATPETIVVFGSNDNHVYGLDADSGCIVWRFDGADADIKTPAVVSEGIVFVGTMDSTLYALSLETGEEQWSSSLSGDMYGSVAVGDGVVYVADSSGNVAVYDISTGVADWTYSLHFSGQDVLYEEVFDEEGLSLSGTVYAVEEYLHVGHIVALDADSGAFKWKFSAQSMIYTAPGIGDALYVASGENKLYRVHKEYGVVQSYFSTEKSIKSTPAIDVIEGVETLYFGADDGNFYAVIVKDGLFVEKWRYSIGSEIRASAAIGEELVYFSAYNKKVYALSKETGEVVWVYETGKKNYAGPVLYNGILYVTSGDHSLHAVDALTGAYLWHYETEGVLYGEPAIVPLVEVSVEIADDAGSDTLSGTDTDALQTEILSLLDDFEVLETEIDELYDSLSSAGGDSTIDTTIDDLVDAYDASLDGFDTEIDALLSANNAIKTDEEYDAVVTSFDELEEDISESVDSYESQIDDVENDIYCLENAEDDDCDA